MNECRHEKIFLNISDISNFLGYSKWTFQHSFNSLLKKHDKEFFYSFIEDSKNKFEKIDIDLEKLNKEINLIEKNYNDKKITKRQYNIKINNVDNSKKILLINKEIIEEKMNIFDSKNFIKNKLNPELIQQFKISKNQTEKKKIIQDLEHNFNFINNKERVHDELNRISNTDHGISNEDNALSLFEKQYNTVLDKSQQFFSKKIHTLNVSPILFEFYICGKVDGLHPDFIVEVKNRKNTFFQTLRIYENIQIQLYLFLLKYSRAKLVQCISNKLKVSDINTNNDFIHEILYKLKIFCNLFIDFLNNEQLKNNYYNLNFKEKEYFLQKYFHDKIFLKFQEYKSLSENNDNNNDNNVDKKSKNNENVECHIEI